MVVVVSARGSLLGREWCPPVALAKGTRLEAKVQKRQGKSAVNARLNIPGDSGFDPLHLSGNPQTFEKLREAEVLHSRWAMLGISGLVVADIYGAQVVLVPELVTQQLLPFTLIALLMVGAVETYRGALAAKEDSSLNQRVYPGRRFNPLGLAENKGRGEGSAPGLGVFSSWLGGVPGWMSGGWWWEQHDATEKEVLKMRTKELKHGRLAMVSFLGAYSAAWVTGKGPITLLLAHLADPAHTTVLQLLS